MPPNDNNLEWRPKGTSLRPLRAIVPFIAPYKRTLVVAIIVLVLAAGATGSLPVAARFLIDNGISTGDPARIATRAMAIHGIRPSPIDAFAAAPLWRTATASLRLRASPPRGAAGPQSPGGGHRRAPAPSEPGPAA